VENWVSGVILVTERQFSQRNARINLLKAFFVFRGSAERSGEMSQKALTGNKERILCREPVKSRQL